ATGYLVSGFLLCVLQTLPLERNFWGFEPTLERGGPAAGLRRVLPPDRVWLATMSWASRNPMAQSASDGSDPSFDPNGSFELRYARHRRASESPPTPVPYQGETNPRRPLDVPD